MCDNIKYWRERLSSLIHLNYYVEELILIA